MLRLDGKVRLALSLAIALARPAQVCVAQGSQPANAQPSIIPQAKAMLRKLSSPPVPVDPVPQTQPASPSVAQLPSTAGPEQSVPLSGLERQPPSAPQVTYRDGQLTIDSQNSTLSQVLRTVQAQTGASLDLPPGAGTERVVAALGPGEPKAVLASLLNGSKFNYVLLGESDNPGGIQKIILLAKTSPQAGATSPNSGGAQGSLTPQPQPSEDEYPPPEPEIDNPAQVLPGQPGFPGGEPANPDAQNPTGRTPEQMLQELQRMQLQQQQMQQQLNPANQGSPFSVPPQPQQQPQPN